MALTDKLVAIGDAIRSKNGTTEAMSLDAMAAAITNLPSGSGGGGFSNYACILDTDGALSATQTISYFDVPDYVNKPYIFLLNWASSSSNFGTYPNQPVVVSHDGNGNFTVLADEGHHVLGISTVLDGTRLKCEWTSKLFGVGGGRYIHLFY